MRPCESRAGPTDAAASVDDRVKKRHGKGSGDLFSRLYAIAKNAFTEITRQPAYGILLLVGMVLIALSPLITAFSMETGSDLKLLVDMGLGTIFMVGLILSVVSATQVVSREIEVKTAGAVISKPVSRLILVTGKFLGVSGAMWAASYLLGIMLILAVRQDVPHDVGWKPDWPVLVAQAGSMAVALALATYANYFYRWNFTSTSVKAALVTYTVTTLAVCVVGIEHDWHKGTSLTLNGLELFAEKNAGPVVAAAVLVALGVWMLSAVAVASSTRLNMVAGVLVCTAVFFVGMVSHYLFGWAVDTPWGSWEVDYSEAERVKVSGQVRTAEGEGIAGVIMSGLPGSVATDDRGIYDAWVRRDGWGSVSPRLPEYVFRPDKRSYPRLASDEANQDYTGVRIEKGWGYGLRTGWKWTAWTAYHVLPSFQLFWVADQLVRPDPHVPWPYVGKAALYAALWCGAMVGFATFLFEGREII